MVPFMSGMELSLKFVSVILGNEREREREKEKENCVNICMCNTHQNVADYYLWL